VVGVEDRAGLAGCLVDVLDRPGQPDGLGAVTCALDLPSPGVEAVRVVDAGDDVVQQPRLQPQPRAVGAGGGVLVGGG